MNKNEAVAHFARKGLLPFSILTYPDFISGWHIRLLCQKLEAVERGEIKRLMVFMPPRHCKSMLCSERFPAWYLGRNPNKQIICATYGDDLARDFGRKVRNLMQTPEYQLTFPNVTLSEDSSAIGKFATNKEGLYISTGVGGALTGRGADILLIDDPIKNRQDADSEVKRKAIWDWYVSTARTRVMPNGAIILIQTRWHKDDLAGKLLKSMRQGGEQWEIVNLPALATQDTSNRKQGEALWKEFWDEDKLEATKKAIGSREWQALYQQTPTDPENQVFHSELFRYYEQLPADTDSMSVLMAVDPAFSKKKTSDYSAIMIVGKHEDKTYILEYSNKRLNPSELIDEILRLYKKWKPYKLGIESFTAQTVIGFYLLEKAQQEGLNLSYEEISQSGDKTIKIKRLEPYFRNGKILMKPHHTELENQLLEFPQGDHDDIIDALQMTFELKITGDFKEKSRDDEYFEELGITYNSYGEPTY